MGGDVHQQAPDDRSGRIAGNPLDIPLSRGARAAIIVMGVCAVVTAGCASAALPESSTPPAAAPSPELTTTLPPPTLTPTAYQETLRSADSMLAPAFDRLTTAG